MIKQAFSHVRRTCTESAASKVSGAQIYARGEGGLVPCECRVPQSIDLNTITAQYQRRFVCIPFSLLSMAHPNMNSQESSIGLSANAQQSSTGLEMTVKDSGMGKESSLASIA